MEIEKAKINIIKIVLLLNFINCLRFIAQNDTQEFEKINCKNQYQKVLNWCKTLNIML